MRRLNLRPAMATVVAAAILALSAVVACAAPDPQPIPENSAASNRDTAPQQPAQPRASASALPETAATPGHTPQRAANPNAKAPAEPATQPEVSNPAMFRQLSAGSDTPPDYVQPEKDMIMEYHLDPAWEPDAIRERIKTLAAMPQRITAENATADQQAVIATAADCARNWEWAGEAPPAELTAELARAEAMASSDDHALLAVMLEHCAGTQTTQAAAASRPGRESATPAAGETLTRQHPLAQRLAPCLQPEHIASQEPGAAATMYLQRIPAHARTAAVNLYCGN